MIEHTRYQRVRTVDGIISTSNGESDTTVTFSKLKRGYGVEFKLVRSDISTDGQSVGNPVNDILKDLSVNCVLDDQGRLSEIRGFAEPIRVAKQKLDPQTYERLMPFLTPEGLSQKFSSEWESRISLLRDRKGQVGQYWCVTNNIVIPPDKNYVSYAVIWIEAEGAGARAGRLKVHTFYQTDPRKLTATLQRFIPQFRAPTFFPLMTQVSPDAEVSGETVYWVEPDTLLIREEYLRRAIDMTVLGDGTPVSTRFTEERATLLNDVKRSSSR